MGFRDREKRRLVPLKPELFSAEACEPGWYRKNRYDFCLRNDQASENLHASIRDAAVDYFRERDIPWHDGIGGGPSNHLCCSQSFCVNFWFPFRNSPGPLAAVLRGLGFDAAEVLPFELDRFGPGGRPGYMAFEWIGERSYLGEGPGGKAVRDDARSRGHPSRAWTHAGSGDPDNLIQISGEPEVQSFTPTIRHAFQRQRRTVWQIRTSALLDTADCQIVFGACGAGIARLRSVRPTDAQQLQVFRDGTRRSHGRGLSCPCCVWRKSNREFVNRVTSPALRPKGSCASARRLRTTSTSARNREF